MLIVNRAKVLRQILFCGFCLAVLCAAGAKNIPAATVTAHADRMKLRIGDTLHVTVIGKWLFAEPALIGANVDVQGDWERGGQAVHSPIRVGDSLQKAWDFQLIGVQADTYKVTPLCYAGGEPTLSSTPVAIRGEPITVIVLPLREMPIWPWYLGGALIVVVSAAILVRSLRTRRKMAYERREIPPLEEALHLLETVRQNRREDRAVQYLNDVERVVQGYLMRRLNRSISGMTAPEIGEAVVPHCDDPEVPKAVTQLLQRCSESKFSGHRIDFETLLGLEEQARSILERLDHRWV